MTAASRAQYVLYGDTMVCEMTFGENYFYSRVLSETRTSKFGAIV